MPSVVVVTDDKVGLLTDISYILGKEGIRMESVGIEAAGGKAVISLSVRDPNKAKFVLAKNGFETVTHGSVVIRLAECFKKMDEIKQRLEDKKVSLQEWKLISGGQDNGLVSLTVDKPRKALKLLSDCAI